MPDLGRAHIGFRTGRGRARGAPLTLPPADWTPDEIIDKAERLQARGAGRITLSAETLQLILNALRLYATARKRGRLDAYVIEAWSGHVDTEGETMAMCAKWGAAKAAYDAVCHEYPTYRVTLRKDCRVVSMRDSTTVRW